MLPYFSVFFFSDFFLFICSLHELKYLYVLLTRYFIHTVTFPAEKFMHRYLLAFG